MNYRFRAKKRAEEVFKEVKKEYSSPQILATFCLWVLFIDANKHNVSVFEKNMEFSLRVGYISVNLK